ncbi:MAG TPA: DUF1015 family protein [Vicinamibacterales bacterium]|nr:DUF1015 family protein [Vicinamibacterales bacterium]
MASLSAFRALRPVPAAAARVAAVPYDVVSTSEARAIAAGEPLSFLHVSRPEIDLPDDTDAHSGAVYARAAANLESLERAAPLVVEESASLYLYRLRMGSHEQTGIAGCFSVDDYRRDVIRKHERTRPVKEDDRTRHILAVGAQTGPVFLIYRVPDAIRSVTAGARSRQPLFDFEASDRVQHTVWRLNAAETTTLIGEFAAIPAMYIADGHHRAAAAARAEAALRPANGPGPWSAFLAVAFPHDEVQVLAYNRVVRDLRGLTPKQLLAELAQRVELHEGPAVPARQGDVAMYLDGRWYTLGLGTAPAELPPDARLDVSRLQTAVLGPLLGIGDVTTDPRIDFVGGLRGTAALEDLVRSGQAAAAFSMHPVSVDDIMQISDAGGIMPPKSSWFEPKLRDGLLVHKI